MPQDGKRPDERDLLLAGIYNLGFIALSAEEGTRFLPWWRERLRRNCLNDPAEGLFVDQRWIDFAPALFEPAILKDPGYNVAYWNLPHRVLTHDGDRILVNGRPLRFFHYSGFSPHAPHLLSKHQHASLRIRLSEMPLLSGLCERYAAALQEAGFAGCDALPYGFAATAGGLPLDTRTRRVLRRTYLDDEASKRATSFPNPFSPAGADDVVQRLMRPSPHAPGVPALLGEIWSERTDLRSAFPRIDSADAERFLDWVRTQGIHEHDIPPQLIPAKTPETATPAARSTFENRDTRTAAMTFMEDPDPFEAGAIAAESLLVPPRANLPSRMQRLVSPLCRLVLRGIRVYWVQQLAIDRALLAAMRTLRRESRSETAGMRKELTELAADVRDLKKRTAATDEELP
jgi:hypothetical protein